MQGERTNFAPSLIAAIALHLAVVLGGLISLPWLSKPVQMINATAVTLVAAPPAPPPPAVQSPEPQTAAAPEPTPQPPKPQPKAAPAPQPTPKPPPPTPQPPKPQPQPTPKPAPAPKPTPQPKAVAKPAPDKGLDLAALTSSLDKAAKPSAWAKGPPRVETASVARDSQSVQQATQNAADAVGQRLNRIWNKSCGVEGFRDIVIRVKFNLSPDGALLGQPQVLDAPPAGNSVWAAAADRAVRAVNQSSPFSELPRQTYNEWRTFTAVFDAKEACKNP